MFRSCPLRQLSRSLRDTLYGSVHTARSVPYILHFHYGITLALRGGFRQVGHCSKLRYVLARQYR